MVVKRWLNLFLFLHSMKHIYLLHCFVCTQTWFFNLLVLLFHFCVYSFLVYVGIHKNLSHKVYKFIYFLNFMQYFYIFSEFTNVIIVGQKIKMLLNTNVGFFFPGVWKLVYRLTEILYKLFSPLSQIGYIVQRPAIGICLHLFLCIDTFWQLSIFLSFHSFKHILWIKLFVNL